MVTGVLNINSLRDLGVTRARVFVITIIISREGAGVCWVHNPRVAKSILT